MRCILKSVTAVSLLVLLSAVPASAELYGFKAVEPIDPAVAAVGESQLTLEVTEPAAGRAQFVIRNNGPAPSVVTLVAIDDNQMMRGVVCISDRDTDGDAGVDFAFDTRPRQLPGANAEGFSTKFSASPDGSPMDVGISPGESLSLVFAMDRNASFEDLIAALDSGLARAGLFVQGVLENGEGVFLSATRITNGDVPVVPVPGSVLLGMIGVGAVGLLQRRRMNQQPEA